MFLRGLSWGLQNCKKCYWPTTSEMQKQICSQKKIIAQVKVRPMRVDIYFDASTPVICSPIWNLVEVLNEGARELNAGGGFWWRRCLGCYGLMWPLVLDSLWVAPTFTTQGIFIHSLLFFYYYKTNQSNANQSNLIFSFKYQNRAQRKTEDQRAHAQLWSSNSPAQLRSAQLGSAHSSPALSHGGAKKSLNPARGLK